MAVDLYTPLDALATIHNNILLSIMDTKAGIRIWEQRELLNSSVNPQANQEIGNQVLNLRKKLIELSENLKVVGSLIKEYEKNKELKKEEQN